MNYEALFARAGDKTVRVGLVGVGDFGVSLLAQSRTIPNLEIAVLCDRDAGRMEATIAACGLRAGDLVMTGDITEDGLPEFDVLVEATGHPEAAAAMTDWAIGRGRHVVMASKEAAIVVGPILHQLAREQGVVYTEVEGDQPSLLIGLISWAKTLGLTVTAAGKSSEYDFVIDDDGLEWRGERRSTSGLTGLWRESEQGWGALCASRAVALKAAGLPRRTVPDFCEMGVVANATGLMPDRPDFHAPLLRPLEVADALRPKTQGGLLDGIGRIDVFNCLRRTDEASFAGGVFVVVQCDDDKTWKLLKEKGHMVSGDARTAMLYNPQHLLGVEAPLSILSAGLLGLPTGATAPRPVVDLVARTSRDFEVGEVLAITDAHHHEVDGLSPELVAARPLADGNPCPYYLAVDRTLQVNVPAGTVITSGMLDLDPEQSLFRLRRRQDRAFLI